MKCLVVKIKAVIVIRENVRCQLKKDPDRSEYELDTGVQFNFVYARFQNVRYYGPIQLEVRSQIPNVA